MRLRAQSLLIALVTLALPVLGWQGVRQLHASLQQERADAQTLRVANLRAALAGVDDLAPALALGATPARAADWYAESAPWPLFVDGYADDWRELAGPELRYADGVGTAATLRLRAATRAGRLYLFVAVEDARVVHHLPPSPVPDPGENERPDPVARLVNGDAVEVYVAAPDGTTTHALLSTIAPGPVDVVAAADRAAGPGLGPVTGEAVVAGDPLPRWQAEWVDGGDGYQIEITLPLPPPGTHVGIAAIDVARHGARRDAWVGSMDPRAMREPRLPATAGRLHGESPAARERLAPWVTAGTRARLYDAAGRLLADVDRLYAPLPEDDTPPADAAASVLDALLFRVFAWFVAGELPLFPETEKRHQPLGLDAARRASVAAGGAGAAGAAGGMDTAGAGAATPTRRYVTVDNDRVLGTLVSVGDGRGNGGYLLFESNEEHAAAFTGSRLARLFGLFVLASLAVTALLFAWGTRLSLRVTRLARDAARAVDADGRSRAVAAGTEAAGGAAGGVAGGVAGGRPAPLAELGADDEIGALSRDLAALLARSADYTRHLEALSGRLAHELGTPLSIVRTSLENVDRGRLDAESRTLVERAGDGAERLHGIARALLESARLEQSVRHAPTAPLDARRWLLEALDGYRQIHPAHAFRAAGSLAGLEAPRRATPLPDVRPLVSAPLLRQALDKLVDNAIDFAADREIVLLLAPAPAGWLTLAVAERGPALAAATRARLFEPSFTTRAAAGAHAGLGLHLVRLIAEAHGGSVFVRDDLPAARDAAGADRWVVVGLRLPLDGTSGRRARQ